MEKLLIDVTEVASLLGVGPSTVKKWSCGAKPAPPGFPRPVKLGARTVWRARDIEEWVESLGKPEQPPMPARRGPGRPRKGAI
jgi:predicted DNA-binding transcriptional regulator AlpA